MPKKAAGLALAAELGSSDEISHGGVADAAGNLFSSHGFKTKAKIKPDRIGGRIEGDLTEGGVAVSLVFDQEVEKGSSDALVMEFSLDKKQIDVCPAAAHPNHPDHARSLECSVQRADSAFAIVEE